MYQFVYWKKVVDTYDIGSIENSNTIWCFFLWCIVMEVLTSQSNIKTKLIIKTIKSILT
jgi:hypothetical protein